MRPYLYSIAYAKPNEYMSGGRRAFAQMRVYMTTEQFKQMESMLTELKMKGKLADWHMHRDASLEFDEATALLAKYTL